MRKVNRRTFLFLACLALVTASGVYWVHREILFGEGELLPWLWLVLFGSLFFNVAYLFLISFFSLFLTNESLMEADLKEFPKTALCYFIRNENTELLYDRMLWSFKGNQLPNLDVWILSDSDLYFEMKELQLLKRLQARYGTAIHYRRRLAPAERKQGNLNDFIHSHPEYDFLYVCDADSLVSPGTVLKLLRKAIHAGNQDIAIFQTLIRSANTNTYYSRFEGISSETSQKLYFNTLQAIFGQTVSFGHHCLIRRDILARIDLPKGLLSHDNWETAMLDQMGYRVCFAGDVMTFDEAPANYLEARKRQSRWAYGTIQGWPLLFMKGLSAGVRFLSFYGIYCYLSQPIFLLWVFLGLLSQSYWTGELLSFRTDAVWFDRFANQNVYFLFLFSLCVIFLHKLVLVRSWKDMRDYVYELFASTLIHSGNFFYGTLDILSIPFRKLVWHPMKKDPFERAGLIEASKMLLPGTALGLAGFLYLLIGTPFPKFSLLPILLSLSFGIPVAVISSKSILKGSVFNVTVRSEGA